MMEQQLEDLAVLYQKLRNYHWNITGKAFLALHEFLEKEYDTVAEEVDEVAELIRMKGEAPLSTYKDFLANATIKEGDMSLSPDAMIQDLIKDYEKLISDFKTQFNGDPKTEDLYTGIISHFEKSVWMMKAVQA